MGVRDATTSIERAKGVVRYDDQHVERSAVSTSRFELVHEIEVTVVVADQHAETAPGLVDDAK